MIHHAALAAAFIAFYAIEPPQEKPVEKKDTATYDLPCPSIKESEQCPERSKDPPAPPLIFDLRVPGGARPAEPEKTKPVLVNPSTVTLSPIPTPSTKGKPTEGED